MKCRDKFCAEAFASCSRCYVVEGAMMFENPQGGLQNDALAGV
jgi:hypothetical protein